MTSKKKRIFKNPNQFWLSNEEAELINSMRQSGGGTTPTSLSMRFDADNNYKGMTRNFKVKPKTGYESESANLEAIRSAVQKSRKYIEQGKSIRNVSISGSQRILSNEAHLFTVMDAHFGGVYWKESAGHNYDLKRAELAYDHIVKEWTKELDAQTPNEIIFVVGNDLFNVDFKSQTHAGTAQTNDYRLQKVMDVVLSSVFATIELFSKYAPVTVVTVSGNHDTEKIVQMGSFMKLYFAKHKNVTIVANQEARKYIKLSDNVVLALSHFDKVKMEKIPGIVSQEVRKQGWTPSTIEAIGGHYHHTMTKEEFGVVSRFLRAMTPPSTWTTEAGYVGAKSGGHKLIYDYKRGYKGEVYFDVDYSDFD